MQYRLHFSVNWDNTLIIMPCGVLADMTHILEEASIILFYTLPLRVGN